MAHFAELKNNIVQRVVVVNNEVLLDENNVEQETIGSKFCSDLFGGKWVQTSYNTSAGVHYTRNTLADKPDNGVPFRGNYAQPGMIYDEEHDAFIHPKPSDTAILNTTTYMWEEPTE
jgi:hypothetical protein